MFENIKNWKSKGVATHANATKEQTIDDVVKIIKRGGTQKELSEVLNSSHAHTIVSVLLSSGYILRERISLGNTRTFGIKINEGKSAAQIREFLLKDRLHRRKFEFKEPNLTPEVGKTVSFALQNLTDKQIGEKMGVTSNTVQKRLNDARHPEIYRSRLINRAIKPKLEVVVEMAKRLEEGGFIELPSQTSYDGWQMHKASQYLLSTLPEHGVYPYIFRFTSGGGRGITTSIDLFGEVVKRKFLVLDKDKFEEFLNLKFSQELREMLIAKNGHQEARLKVLTRILHDHGIHSGACGHNWKEMGIRAEDFKHEIRREEKAKTFNK